MIGNSFAIGVSGLGAAQSRLAISANNVVNQQSVAPPSVEANDVRRNDALRDDAGRDLFQPLRAVDQPLENGGVRSLPALVDPSSVQRFDPSAPDADAEGLVNRPNIQPEREVAEQIFARTQFQANLATVRAADELLESTLDILA